MFNRRRRSDPAEIEATATLRMAAPPEVVFAALDDEQYFWLLRPHVRAHEITRFHPDGGHDCRQLIAFNAKPAWITSTSLVYDPPKQTVTEVQLPYGSCRESCDIRAVGGGSEVTLGCQVTFSDDAERASRRAVGVGLEFELKTYLARLRKVTTAAIE